VKITPRSTMPSHICRGTTKKGDPCKNKVKEGKYCYLHEKKKKVVRKEKVKEEEKKVVKKEVKKKIIKKEKVVEKRKSIIKKKEKTIIPEIKLEQSDLEEENNHCIVCSKECEKNEKIFNNCFIHKGCLSLMKETIEKNLSNIKKEDCCVCLESTYDGECCEGKHFIHKNCIIKSGKDSCPLCRRETLKGFLSKEEMKELKCIHKKFDDDKKSENDIQTTIFLLNDQISQFQNIINVFVGARIGNDITLTHNGRNYYYRRIRS
jgi:hypothetical protein